MTSETNEFKSLKTPERAALDFRMVKRAAWIAFAILLCVGLPYAFWVNHTKKRLYENHVIINGAMVINAASGGKGSPEVNFKLTINGKIYNKAVPGLGSDLSYLVNHAFPIAFVPGDTDNNYLLVTPEDFKGFNVPFPDSLKWVNNKNPQQP